MLYVIFHMMRIIIALTKMALGHQDRGISSCHLWRRWTASTFSSCVWAWIRFLWTMQQWKGIKAIRIIMHDLAASIYIVIEQRRQRQNHFILFHFVWSGSCKFRWFCWKSCHLRFFASSFHATSWTETARKPNKLTSRQNSFQTDPSLYWWQKWYRLL